MLRRMIIVVLLAFFSSVVTAAEKSWVQMSMACPSTNTACIKGPNGTVYVPGGTKADVTSKFVKDRATLDWLNSKAAAKAK